MRGNNKVIAVDLQIVNRHGRQVELQRLPVAAVVKGEKDARLSARKQKPLALWIFMHRPHVGAIGNAVGREYPVLAAIASAEDHGPEIVKLVAINGDVCRVRVVM